MNQKIPGWVWWLAAIIVLWSLANGGRNRSPQPTIAYAPPSPATSGYDASTPVAQPDAYVGISSPQFIARPEIQQALQSIRDIALRERVASAVAQAKQVSATDSFAFAASCEALECPRDKAAIALDRLTNQVFIATEDGRPSAKMPFEVFGGDLKNAPESLRGWLKLQFGDRLGVSVTKTTSFKAIGLKLSCPPGSEDFEAAVLNARAILTSFAAKNGVTAHDEFRVLLLEDLDKTDAVTPIDTWLMLSVDREPTTPLNGDIVPFDIDGRDAMSIMSNSGDLSDINGRLVAASTLNGLAFDGPVWMEMEGAGVVTVFAGLQP